MNPVMWQPKTIGDVVEFLRGLTEKWQAFEVYQKSAQRNSNGRLADSQVERYMYGHPVFDDPPKGWSKRDLLMFGRGYLMAHGVQVPNCAQELRGAIWALGEVEKALAQGESAGGKK